MNRRISGVISMAAGISLAAFAVPTTASAVPADDAAQHTDRSAGPKQDNRPDKLHEKRAALKQAAVEKVAKGEAKVVTKGKSRAVETAGGQWVEYGTQETAQLLSFLVEFGDQVDPRFADAPAGPVHNQIPEPPAEDNSTYWQPDFSTEHFKQMFFTGLPDQNGESFRDLYDEMSSGRFDVQGDVSDWVTVPYHEASYGQTESNGDMTRFIQDAANAWYADQLARGKTKDEIVAYLKSFDVWDRYDIDGDGNFAEADGYIDHFQAIHAGEGEEAGAPEWAIWSHRWAANPTGAQGPANFPKVGGVRIGDTDLWIRDYTTEPENGGLGVFAHEFGHDLGLPDYYDTVDPTPLDNGTGFWNLMSSGSWLGHGAGDVGTTPDHMGATEKLFLGWLDYEYVAPGETETIEVGASYHATKKAQAVIADLPPGKEFVDVAPEYDGAYLYSGTGDERTSTATSAPFTVPAGASLAAKVNYSIETDWDYAYVEVATDGQTFTPLATNLSTSTDPNGQNEGHGITGSSEGQWVDLTADLSAYAGKSVTLRFRHFNDAAYHEFGIAIDDISVGTALVSDGDAEGWTLDGFSSLTGGGYYADYSRYYVAEHRTYRGYDATLRTGPYNYAWTITDPERVQQFPYQDGLLIWYVNGLYGDNNTSVHPGYGEALPVDAHPVAQKWSGGDVTRGRFQTYDATFGLEPTEPLDLVREIVGGLETVSVPSQPAVRVFDDSDVDRYWDPANPQGSTKVAGTGTTIAVTDVNKNKDTMTVQVN